MLEINPEIGGDFDTWRDFYETMIDWCDQLWVLMLDGWEDSVGVQAEIEYAERLDKSIMLIETSIGSDT